MFAIVICLVLLMCTLTILSYVLCVLMVEGMFVVVNLMLSLMRLMSPPLALCDLSSRCCCCWSSSSSCYENFLLHCSAHYVPISLMVIQGAMMWLEGTSWHMSCVFCEYPICTWLVQVVSASHAYPLK